MKVYIVTYLIVDENELNIYGVYASEEKAIFEMNAAIEDSDFKEDEVEWEYFSREVES